ncbi:MAG: DctP family TRAP transporter solute-binding subunit [Bacillota bacterium]
MKRYLLLSLALVFLVVLALSGCASKPVQTTTPTPEAPKKMVWKIGAFFHEQHSLTRALFVFKAEMEKRVGDKVTIQIYPNLQLGGGREMVEGVQLGTIQACEATLALVSAFDSSFFALNLPYLFLTREIAFDFLDGPIGTEMAKNLEKSGIKILGYFENGIRHVTNNVRPIRTPADLRGLKIRTMENPVHLATFRNLGANPTPMAFGEVFTALQQGTIDGQENPFANIAAMKFDEVQKYMTLTGHFYDVTGFMMNLDLYKGLPEDIRKAVDESAAAAVKAQRKFATEDEERFHKEFLAKGSMSIIELTDAERLAFKEAALKTYDEMADRIGKEMLQKILAEVQRIEAKHLGK